MKKKLKEFFSGPKFRQLLLVWAGIMLSPICMAGIVLGKMKGALERYVLLIVIGILLTVVNLFAAYFMNTVFGHIDGMNTYFEYVILFSIAEFVALSLGCISMSVARRLPGSVQVAGWVIKKATLAQSCAVLLSAGAYFGLHAENGDPFSKVVAAVSLIQNADEETQETIRKRLGRYTEMRKDAMDATRN